MSIVKKLGRGVARFLILIVFVIAVFLMRASTTQGAEPTGGSYIFAAIALAVAFVGLRYFAQPRMIDGPDWVRHTNLVSAMGVLVGLFALLLNQSVVGQVILYPSFLAFGVSFCRVDLILEEMRNEAAAAMWRRLAYGGAGFAVVYAFAIFSKDSALSLRVFELALFVMVMIVGFMTAASRIAHHREYFLALAGKEPAPIRQLPGEMIYDHAAASHHSVRGWLTVAFYLYFALVVFVSGVVAIPYLLYLLVRGAPKADPPVSPET